MHTSQQPLSLLSFVGCFLAIIGVRLGVDLLVHTDGVSYSAMFLYLEFLHTGLFFGWAFLLIGMTVAYWAQISWRTSFTHLLFLFLFIAFPPIIDRLISVHLLENMRFFSYYLFDGPGELLLRYLTFFGDNPHDGITYGTRIMVAFATLYLTGYVWHYTRSIFRSLGTAFSIYMLFFLLGSIPSLLTYIFLWDELLRGTLTKVNVAQTFTSATLILTQEIDNIRNTLNKKMSLFYALFVIGTALVMFWRAYKQRFWILMRHIRPLQMTYHAGLLVFGIGLALIFTQTAVLWDPFSVVAAALLVMLVTTAWTSTVFFNDVADLNTDRITHTDRPLPTGSYTPGDYRALGTVTLILSVLLIPLITPSGFVFMLLYHTCAWIYSMPPLRLKRFPLLATFTAALASLMIIFIGYTLVAPTHTLLHFPLPILSLILGGLAIALTLKDFRDIDGDRADNTLTIPVFLGESRARLVVGSGIFLSYMACTALFAGPLFFVNALIAGTLSYLMITYRKGDLYLTSRDSLTHTIFLITALFLAVSMWILFLA